MMRRFIRMEYEFPSKKTGLTFEVDMHERTYLTQKIDEIIEGLNMERNRIGNIELLEIIE